MKQLILLCVCVLSVNLAVAQKKAIKISKNSTGKEKLIKENKRIRITTVDGEKYKGRFSIKDDQSIEIDGEIIQLDDIAKIKRNSLLLNILTSGSMIYVGSALVGIGALIGLLTDSSTAYLLTIPGAALITGGILSPNLSKGYKKDKDWSFEIITLPNN